MKALVAMLELVMVRSFRVTTLVVILSGLSGCFSESNSNVGVTDNSPNSSDRGISALDAELQSIIREHNLTGDPSEGRVLPSIDDPKSQLGMDLFFSKALSGDQDAACVTCHHPALGGGDDLSLPIGVDSDDLNVLGPGRMQDGDYLPNVPRNAPTTFNIALWDQVLFHDGRIEALDKQPLKNGSIGGIRTPDSWIGYADPGAGSNMTIAQARFPVTSAEEMRGHILEAGNSNEDVRKHLANRLEGRTSGLLTPDADGNGTYDWPERFTAVYGPGEENLPLITFEKIAEAIAAYEASQVFVDTPWKAYVEGDHSALSESEKSGAKLFFTPVDNGGAGCSACHSGDFFTDEKFHNIAMIQIGPGKGDGDGAGDFGRFRETTNPSDKYAFRTPTLLNVEHTGPYGHAGSYDNLEDVIRHHLNPILAIEDFFSSPVSWCKTISQFADVFNCDELYPSAESHTLAALYSLLESELSGENELVFANLSDSEVADLTSFLRALSDPCLVDASCIGQWIPDAGTSGPAGGQINAVDLYGYPLQAN